MIYFIQMNRKRFWIIVLLLSLYLCIFSFQKINFLTADIGRHIKNGDIFLHSAEFGISKSAVLYTNLFSYTYPDFPFINHHWGSGFIAYLIYSVGGFSGLSLVYGLLIILAFILALFTVREEADLWSIFLAGLFLTPLIADRTEIRPEAVSYFLIAVFICLLYQFSKGRLSYKTLFLIPILEVFWSNLHIYFIFGPFLVGVFLFERLVKRDFENAKKLAVILGLTFMATFITPYGLSGVIYPFTIFRNYGYMIVENQSIPFLEKLGFANASFLWYKITLGLVLVSSIAVLIKRRKDFAVALLIISLTFVVLGFLGIRHLSTFALVALPLLAYNFSIIGKTFFQNIPHEIIWFSLDSSSAGIGRPVITGLVYGLVSFLIIVTTFVHFSNKLAWNRDFGLGLSEHSLDSINFIKTVNIDGPIFNNYDIGGAMIFSLFPQEKVFVDNRPEAYPTKFFTDTYIPMQQDPTVFQKIDAQYHFNVIYFYRLDMTPWSQSFLIQMIDDKSWTPVYVDGESIIFLKQNEGNKNIIAKYKLPRNMFSRAGN